MDRLDEWLASADVDLPLLQRASELAQRYGHPLLDDATNALMDAAYEAFGSGSMNDELKIGLAMDLFERAPSYTVGMVLSMEFDDLSTPAQELFWQRAISILEAGGIAARELDYVIRVDAFLDRSEAPRAAHRAVRRHQSRDRQQAACRRLHQLLASSHQLEAAGTRARMNEPLSERDKEEIRAAARHCMLPDPLRPYLLCELFRIAPSATAIEAIDGEWHELDLPERTTVCDWVVRNIDAPVWIATPWEPYVSGERPSNIARDLPGLARQLLRNEQWQRWRSRRRRKPIRDG